MASQGAQVLRRREPLGTHRVIAANLDAGTDNEALLNASSYPGNRHARIRGDRYDAFIAAYLQTASTLFPSALLHFEDFGPGNARRILVDNADTYRIFNDDMQNTGAIVMSARHRRAGSEGNASCT